MWHHELLVVLEKAAKVNEDWEMYLLLVPFIYRS